MIELIEDLLSRSGGDGDFIKGGIPATPNISEIARLLEAWSRERGHSVD
jgi:hypothetical protein